MYHRLATKAANLLKKKDVAFFGFSLMNDKSGKLNKLLRKHVLRSDIRFLMLAQKQKRNPEINVFFSDFTFIKSKMLFQDPY